MSTIAKGVLSFDQQSLTLRQRDRFNQLVQAGIDPKVARQLAIVLVKSALSKAYDPSQPRDDQGQWTDGGGGGSATSAPSSTGGPGGGVTATPLKKEPLKPTPATRTKPSGGKPASQAEVEQAVKSYKNFGYYDINEAAKNYDTAKPKNARDKANRRSAEALSQEIDKNSIEKATTLYRGLGLPPGLKLGDTLESHGFTSASASKAVANKFANASKGGGDKQAVFATIRVPAGAKALNISKYYSEHGGEQKDSEKEYLFGHQTKFRIAEDNGMKNGVRQLVLEPVSGVGKSATPPATVRSSARRGLDQMTEHGGAGLTEGAKARARVLAAGKAVSAKQAARIAAFHARHGAQGGAMTDDKGNPTPKAVATNLWGGKGAKGWADKVAAAKAAVMKGDKPLGAAYARARRKQKEEGGKFEDHVNAYLRSKGHEGVNKTFDPSQPRNDQGEWSGGGGDSGGDGPHTPAADASKSDVGSGPGQAGARGKPFGAMSTRDHVKEAAKRLAQAAKAKASGNEKKHAEHLAAYKAHADAAKAGLANKKVATDEEYRAAHWQLISAYTKGGVDLQNRLRAAMPSHIRDALDTGNRAIGRMERAEDRKVSKGGPGSGPHPGPGKTPGGSLAAASMHLAAGRQARAKGEHAKADDHFKKAHAMVQAALGAMSTKKSYSAAFVQQAKDTLPRTYFDQLHVKARAKSGGSASGMSRRAAGDETKGEMMARRKALQAELAALDAQLKKSAPLAQEVNVDATIPLSPKQKKARRRLSQKLVDDALNAVKSLGTERVAVQVSARVVKAAQPEWKRIVHSVVYSPGDVDAHGDYMEPEDIEKMAHEAMRSGLYVNHEHQAGSIEADIVESYIAPQDFNLTLDDGSPYHIPKGSHVMAMHVWGDEPWQRVLSGEYAGFSLEGTALREAA